MNQRQREQLEHYRAYARSRGGVCLSRQYRNLSEKMRFRCAEGHEWSTTANTMRLGTWCPSCANANRHARTKAETFARVQALARARGGLCLSTEYVGAKTSLRFRCAEGHEWEAAPHNISLGSWCPRCLGRRLTIDDMHELARARGGLCLSSEYVNSYTHLRWRCADGHEWDAAPTKIREGHWCGVCSNATRRTAAKAERFKRVQALARLRGGRCLSSEYVNSYTNQRFRCADGHEWETKPENIVRGAWCPRCSSHTRTIDDMHELARAQDGRCLSTEYVDARTHLRWRCAEGHEWSAAPLQVRRGTWCARCSGAARKTIADVQAMAAERGGVCLSTTINSIAEPLRFRCRVGHEFVSDANHLQQGHWCPRCHRAPLRTLERLRQAAERQGGVLLDVEAQGDVTSVRLRCRDGHEWTMRSGSLINGHWCRECYVESLRGRSPRRLSISDMQEVAASRGGRCLSEIYVSNRIHLRWQCHDGHEWEAAPSAVRGGTWCPVCAYRHCGSIDGMRALAAERGGTCRSRTYLNRNEELQFTCARGHKFTATGSAVRSGVWCPTCSEIDARPRPRRRGPAR